jgi:deoxyribodipyrimidine photo-lyase
MAQLKAFVGNDLPPEKAKRLTQWRRSLRACASRVHWRCHFVQKLESRPAIEFRNQNSGFDQIRQEINHDLIDRRYHGQTGIPLVDAGMRCLHATGWINFRMRAMLTSFICNTCMQPWQAIAHPLARVFVDYEP